MSQSHVSDCFVAPTDHVFFHKPYICRPVMSGTAVLVTEASCRPLTMCLCNSIINCNSVSTHENKIPFASLKAMKKAFPYLSEQRIGYTGYRSGESGWGDKSLPRTGHIHVSQLSLGEEHSLHCDPYKMRVTAALGDIVLREDLPTIQVCKLGKSGLCTDGPYSSAVLGLAVGILAVAGIAAVDDLPLHVQRFLGAIRVSAQPDIGGRTGFSGVSHLHP